MFWKFGGEHGPLATPILLHREHGRIEPSQKEAVVLSWYRVCLCRIAVKMFLFSSLPTFLQMFLKQWKKQTVTVKMIPLNCIAKLLKHFYVFNWSMFIRIRQISASLLPCSTSVHMFTVWYCWNLVAWCQTQLFLELWDIKVLPVVLEISGWTILYSHGCHQTQADLQSTLQVFVGKGTTCLNVAFKSEDMQPWKWGKLNHKSLP